MLLVKPICSPTPASAGFVLPTLAAFLSTHCSNEALPHSTILLSPPILERWEGIHEGAGAEEMV